MTLRQLVYEYKSLKELIENQENILDLFWQELLILAKQRESHFRGFVCQRCGQKLNLISPFADYCYVDRCGKCDHLNIFRFVDLSFIENVAIDKMEMHKTEILKVAWERALLIFKTKLPGKCEKCQTDLSWFCTCIWAHEFACTCSNCGRFYFQQSL